MGSTSQARDALLEEQYDLLILDVILPKSPTHAADTACHSMDLLTDIKETDEFNQPLYIIGITGDKEAYNDHSLQFSNNTWTICRYSASDDSWVHQITSCIEYINNQSSQGDQKPLSYDIDLAIVCALDSPELQQILKLNWNWSSAKPLTHLVFIYEGHFESGGKRFRVAASSSGRMGMVESALLSSTIIEMLRPRCLAMTGICAGVPEKTSMGDVLFADPVWDYQCGKQVADTFSSLQIEPQQIPADQEVRCVVKEWIKSEKFKKIYIDYPGNISISPPTLRIGPVVTGSAVLADGKIIQDLPKQNRKLLGVEMEIYGVYAAAQKARLKTRVFALKSVCDFGCPEKGDDVQDFASYLSAQCLGAIMEDYAHTLLSD